MEKRHGQNKSKDSKKNKGAIRKNEELEGDSQ